MALGDTVRLAGWLSLTPTLNTGAAFGLLRGFGPFLAVLAVLTAAVLLVYGTKSERPPLVTGALGLMLGGTLSNLADRLLRGHVYDFIDLRVWPVFNLADCALTVGAALLILTVLFPQKRLQEQ